LFSDEFGEIPLRIRELAVSTAEEKAGYNYSSPNFKEALENAIDDIYKAYPSCVICKDCSSFPSFEAALFVPRDDLSFLKCEDKTKSLTTASALLLKKP
jgi:hypothetical protein